MMLTMINDHVAADDGKADNYDEDDDDDEKDDDDDDDDDGKKDDYDDENGQVGAGANLDFAPASTLGKGARSR